MRLQFFPILVQSAACPVFACLILSWAIQVSPQRVTDLQPAWDDLGSSDATSAYRAIWTMAKSPDHSIAFIESRLSPIVEPDPQRLMQLIADLGSNTFSTREKAKRELEQMAELAASALIKANVNGLPLETKLRIERLLSRLEEPVPLPDQLRQFRGLEVLELVGTDAARKLVKDLAEGSLQSRLTKQAKATLERLANKRDCAADVIPQPNRDWYDDPLPKGAVVRLGTTRLRDARHVVFLPDGKSLIVSRYSTLHHYDWFSGKEVAGFPITDSEVFWDNAAISPDGRVMAASSGLKVGLRELPSGKPLHTFSVADDSGGFNADHTVAFSSDGSVLSAANNWTAYSWNLTTRKMIKQFRHSDHHDGRTVLAVFSADGKYLAVGNGDKGVPVWDVTKGKLLYRLDGHEGGIWCAAFSPDGRTLATGGYADKTVRLWEVSTGKLRQEFAVRTTHVTSVAFAPDSKEVVAVGWTFALSNIKNSREIYCSDVISSPGKSRIFEIPTARWVRYTPDGKALVCCHDWVAVGFLDPTSGKELRPFEAHRGGISAVAFSTDGAIAATGCNDETVQLWDAATGKPLKTFTGLGGTVDALAFSNDGKELRSSAAGVVVLWDMTTGERKKTVHHGKPGGYASFSTDGRRFATTGESLTQVNIWDLASGTVAKTFQSPDNVSGSLVFSPDGTMLAECRTGGILVREVATGKVLRNFPVEDGRRGCVAFSADGRTLAGTVDRRVVVWELLTGKERLSFSEHHFGWGCSLAFPDKGRYLAFGRRRGMGSTEPTVLVWALADGNKIGPFLGHMDDVNALAFTPDNCRLATASDDSTVLFWAMPH